MAIKNNTLSKNIACYGGAIFVFGSPPLVVNSILWDDSSEYGGDEISGVVTASYCDIEGGWSGEGNINTDPRFRDPYNVDYRLSTALCGDTTESPCIDRGIDTISDQVLNCELGLGDSLSDMGAFGGGNAAWPTAIGDEQIPLPEKAILSQNYPNPFNSSTSISFTIPDGQQSTLNIYDICGRSVRAIPVKGSGSIVWNGLDNAGSSASSGVYFYSIASQPGTARKMVLLK